MITEIMSQFEDGAITEYEAASMIILRVCNYLQDSNYQEDVFLVMQSAYEQLNPDTWGHQRGCSMKINFLLLIVLFPFIVSALFIMAVVDICKFCWAAWRQS